MYLAVRNFVILNEGILKNIVRFIAAFIKLQAYTDEIQLIGKIQGTNKTGLALDKNRLRKALIAITLKNANKLAILAKLINNGTLLREVRLNESDLARVPDVTVKDMAQVIYDRVETNLNNLAEQGISSETQKKFLETITAYNNAIATPRTGITEKRQATQKLTVLFKSADEEIDIMDLAVGSVKDEYPDLYNGYKNSRKLVDTSSGSLTLIAAAKDITNAMPVSGATFIFKHESSLSSSGNGNGGIVKKTSKKGNFHIKTMETGNYKVKVSSDGYKEKELMVSIPEGRRTELTVELEKV